MSDKLTEEIDRCDVYDCCQPAIATVQPTYGATEHTAYRCRECLLRDLEKEWFTEWRSKIEGRA